MKARMLLTVITILLLSSHIRAETTITLKSEAATSGTYIRLGEICLIVGPSSVTPYLEKIFIGPAPSVGNEIQISRAMVLERIQELGLRNSIIVRGSKAVRVTRKSTAVKPSTSPSQNPQQPSTQPTHDAALSTVAENDNARKLATMGMIAQAIRRRMYEAVGTKSIRVQIEVDSVSEQPPSTTRIMEFRSVLNGSLPGHNRSVRLVCKDNLGRTLAYCEARVDVKIMAPIATMRRTLQKGEEVREGDIVIRVEEFRAGKAIASFDPADAIGRTATHMLRQGQTITASDFTSPLDVRQGTILQAVMRNGSFSVSERVRALQNGRRGDMITVQPLRGKKPYQVKVTGPNIAEIIVIQ